MHRCGLCGVRVGEASHPGPPRRSRSRPVNNHSDSPVVPSQPNSRSDVESLSVRQLEVLARAHGIPCVNRSFRRSNMIERVVSFFNLSASRSAGISPEPAPAAVATEISEVPGNDAPQLVSSPPGSSRAVGFLPDCVDNCAVCSQAMLASGAGRDFVFPLFVNMWSHCC